MTDAEIELEAAAPDVSGAELGHALSHVDFSIETYVERCRKRIPAFVESHFSLKQTWDLQRRSLGFDLLCAPINSAWALPHLAIRRVAEGLERLGYAGVSHWAGYVPSGIKTTYQSRIEHLICSELLEWDREGEPAALPQGFLKELGALSELRKLLENEEVRVSGRDSARALSALLRQYSAGRAIVSDVSGTLLTLALSWWTLGNASMSLKGIAYSVAKKQAHDRAASRFFLGRKLGSSFYRVFPPAVHENSVRTILVLVVAGLTVGAMACTILSDPIRKSLGFHRNRLEILLDEIEKELILLAHKHIKPRLRAEAGL